MKKLWEVVKRYKFFLAFFSVNIALLFILPDTGWRSFEITGDNLLEMLSILPPTANAHLSHLSIGIQRTACLTH